MTQRLSPGATTRRRRRHHDRRGGAPIATPTMLALCCSSVVVVLLLGAHGAAAAANAFVGDLTSSSGITDPDSTVVLNSTSAGGTLYFALNFNPSGNTLVVSTLTLSTNFTCTLAGSNNPIPTIWNASCTVGSGYGGNYRLWIISTSGTVYHSTPIRFPRPALTQGSLRTMVNATVSTSVTSVTIAANATTILYFNGTNLYPFPNGASSPVITVSYFTNFETINIGESTITSGIGALATAGVGITTGTINTAGTGPYTCTVIAATSTSLSCMTQPGAVGRRLQFQVTLGTGANSVSSIVPVMPPSGWQCDGCTDTLSYQSTPVISKAYGCDIIPPGQYYNASSNPNNFTTSNCPTAGGIPLYLFGSNLYPPIYVSLGTGQSCNSLDPDKTNPNMKAVTPCISPASGFSGHSAADFALGSCIMCLLPPGTGSKPTISPTFGVIYDTGLQGGSSASVAILNYSNPTLLSINGSSTCTQKAPNLNNNTHDISNCPREGGAIITIRGRNLGTNAPKILVGGYLIESVNVFQSSDVTLANSEVRFILPAGTGSTRAVLLLQNGGGLGTGEVINGVAQGLTLSYYQCPTGRYQQGASVAPNCTECDVGKVSIVEDATACTQCLDGEYSVGSACLPCSSGSYSMKGNATCTNCSIGYEQLAKGQPTCNPCAAGKYSNTTATASCTGCEKGKYSNIQAATACIDCTGVRYQDSTGQTACQTCLAGQYYNGDICQNCPAGAVCDSQRGIVTSGNWFVYFDNNVHPNLLSTQCLPGYCGTCEATANGTNNLAFDPITQGTIFTCCSDNRPPAAENPLCGACFPGYTVYGNVCVPCTTTDGGILFGLLLVQWLYITVFHVFAQIDNADLRIFLNFIQFVFLFLSTQASNLTAWLSLFNFNFFQSLSTQCVAPLSDMQSLASGIYVPIFGFILLLVNIGIHYGIWRLMRGGFCNCKICTETKYESTNPITGFVRSEILDLKQTDSFTVVLNRYRRTFLGFLANSYTSFGQTVFSFFSCVDVNGDKFVQSYPTLSCLHSAEYLRLFPLFVFMAALLAALPVAIAFRLFMLNRQGLLFGRKDIRLVYGALIEAYTPSKYAWECWVLVRRLIITAVALDTYPENLAQKFTYLCMCNILFLGIHYLARPYVLATDNYAESLSLVVLTLLTLFLISAPVPLTQSYAAGLTAMTLSVAGAFALRILFTRYEEMWRFKKDQEKRKKEKLEAARKKKHMLDNDEDFYADEAKQTEVQEAAAASQEEMVGGDAGVEEDAGGFMEDRERQPTIAEAQAMNRNEPIPTSPGSDASPVPHSPIDIRDDAKTGVDPAATTKKPYVRPTSGAVVKPGQNVIRGSAEDQKGASPGDVELAIVDVPQPSGVPAPAISPTAASTTATAMQAPSSPSAAGAPLVATKSPSSGGAASPAALGNDDDFYAEEVDK